MMCIQTLIDVLEFNQYHKPKGPGGGQFARKGGTRSLLDFPGDDMSLQMPYGKIDDASKRKAKAFVDTLSRNAIENAPLESVQIGKLLTGQSRLSKTSVEYFRNGGTPGALEKDIVVANVGGKLYVMNGNHRVAVAWENGQDTIKARVIKVP
jgi:hypothetical protein